MQRNQRRIIALYFGFSMVFVWFIYGTIDTGRASILRIDITPTAFVFLPQIFKPDIPTPTPSPTPIPWLYERKAEYPDEYTVGKMIRRSNACGLKVHGQLGTINNPPWPAKSGYAKYIRIQSPRIDQLVLRFRYSKNSSSYVPLLIYLDDESTPRAIYHPADQGDWNRFAWTDSISLGGVHSGSHSIKFYTDGQQYGVVDLDMFCLADYALDVNNCSCN